MSKDIAIIGAGMAGLSAATHLSRAGAKVTVFEREPVPGGRTRSINKDGYTFDIGAITLSPAYTETLALIKQANGEDLFELKRPILAIAKGDRLASLNFEKPVSSLLSSNLLSLSSMLRATRLLPSLMRTWHQSDFDGMSKLSEYDSESVHDFANRLLGQEFCEYVADPIIRQNMFTDTRISSKVDLLWSIKMFAGLSLIHVRGGLGEMSKRLSEPLDIKFNTEVDLVENDQQRIKVSLKGERERFYDAAIIATTLPVAEKISPRMPERLRTWMQNIKPVKSTTVHVGLNRELKLEPAIILVPSRTCSDIVSIVIETKKTAARAPEGCDAITLHMHSSWNHRQANKTHDAIVAEALSLASPLIGKISPDEIATHYVHSWDYLDHERHVGIYEQLREIEPDLLGYPISYAGEFFSAGIEGAVRAGRRAAESILAGASVKSEIGVVA